MKMNVQPYPRNDYSHYFDDCECNDCVWVREICTPDKQEEKKNMSTTAQQVQNFVETISTMVEAFKPPTTGPTLPDAAVMIFGEKFYTPVVVARHINVSDAHAYEQITKGILAAFI